MDMTSPIEPEDVVRVLLLLIRPDIFRCARQGAHRHDDAALRPMRGETDASGWEQ